MELGHAFYPNTVTFKNSSNNCTVFSFSTTFVFAVRSQYAKLCGHGAAFVIAPTRGLLGASPSGYLGLFNETSNGKATNHVFAVELDTVQDFVLKDANDNHVGNGVNSKVSAAAGFYVGESLLHSGQPIHVWVEYDSTKKQINVSLALICNGKPYTPLLSLMHDLSPILNKKMYVGLSAATGFRTAFHDILCWSFKMNGQAEEFALKLPHLGHKERSKLFPIGLPVIFVSFVLLAILTGVTYDIRRKKKFSELLEDWELEYGPQRFKYKDFYIATKGFREKELLGKGGFGKVYRGILSSSRIEIAVKRVSHESRQGMKEFVAEIVSNGLLRH